MTTALTIGGWLFCTFAVLGVVSAATRLALRRSRVRAILYGDRLFPYTAWLRFRSKGCQWTLARALRLPWASIPGHEVVEAHRRIRLVKMQALRDVMREVDELPTVVQGKKAMGISSVFDLARTPAHLIASPYSHPLQRPPYFLPGVPARKFYDPAEFEWSQALLDSYPVILEELRGVLADDGKGFKAYLSEYNRRVVGWNTFNFFFFGKKVEENCERCPRTTALLEALPRFERDHIMFSALNPRATIPPHTGPINGIIRAHLGLVVPPGCFITVGDEDRGWEAGKLLIFDDSFVHRVCNHSDAVRIVLFMNFWHPCFSPEEIAVLERYRTAYEQTPNGVVHYDNQMAARGHDMTPVAAARARTAVGTAGG